MHLTPQICRHPSHWRTPGQDATAQLPPPTFGPISNYMQKRNKPNSGYNYTGLSRRIAMGIGLHKEFPTWEASLFEVEMRRRIWHCLYIFDVGAIITFSRPLDFPDDGIDVELPLNIHDTVSALK